MRIFNFQDTSNQLLILIEKLCKTFWIFKKFTCSLNRELREVHPSIYMIVFSFNFSSFISLFFILSFFIFQFFKIMSTAHRKVTIRIQ